MVQNGKVYLIFNPVFIYLLYLWCRCIAKSLQGNTPKVSAVVTLEVTPHSQTGPGGAPRGAAHDRHAVSDHLSFLEAAKGWQGLTPVWASASCIWRPGA